MNNQIKQRLYITLVAFTLLWLLCMGVINQIQIQETRSLALSECLKDNFKKNQLAKIWQKVLKINLGFN
jgi:hypothetical protein